MVDARAPGVGGAWVAEEPETCRAFPAEPLNLGDACGDLLPSPRGRLLVESDRVFTFDSDSSVLSDLSSAVAIPSALVAQAGGDPVRVVAMADLTLLGRLEVRGSWPLVFLVHGSATIRGSFNIGPFGGGCALGIGGTGAAPGGDLETGGGGGGAGYGALGGEGGEGNSGAPGGTPGSEEGGFPLAPLRPGCRGGHGGSELTQGGLAGFGGGALQISARDRLEIAGTVNAGGGGGHGGGFDGNVGSGGGGGGSGGSIVLEAASLAVASTASVCANGGAGGEGGVRGAAGADGAGGGCREPAVGAETHSGGNGGAGGYFGGDAMPGEPPNSGTRGAGGGGGGAVGRIQLRGEVVIDPAALITPSPP